MLEKRNEGEFSSERNELTPEKRNGGELIIIFILVLAIVAGAFYLVTSNRDINDTINEMSDGNSTINVEVPDDVNIIPNQEENQ